MRYALLVCFDEKEELSAEEQQRRYAAYVAFQDELETRGNFVSRERLKPTGASTTVRRRDGGLVVADGPFAETKEQIAGFFVVECEDLDEATDAGAEVHRGSLDDLDGLRAGAAASDGVIHLAYRHDLSFSGNFEGAAEADHRAIETFGEALAGSDRSFVIASGTLGLAPGRVATEQDGHGPDRLARLSPAV